MAEKGEEEQAVVDEKKVVCIRCGAEVSFSQVIVARRDRKGAGSMRTCGGCGAGECKVKEAEGNKAVLIPGFFNIFSASDEAVRAAEEMAKARGARENAEIALEKG